MAINLKSTANLAVNGVKVLVYGAAGIGKTTLIRTLPNPQSVLILSAEGGLLSLSGSNLMYLEISNIKDFDEYYTWLASDAPDARQFTSIALDNISEIAEVVLTHEKEAGTKDPRVLYPAVQDAIASRVRKFRDMPGKNVYFTAKLDQKQTETGEILYSPAMPGSKLGQALPYWVDEVLALRLVPDANGNQVRALQCVPDNKWSAKDRSGRLAPIEAPDLSSIIKKITTPASDEVKSAFRWKAEVVKANYTGLNNTIKTILAPAITTKMGKESVKVELPKKEGDVA